MIICGINSSHTASAALVKDGQILCALQEERPTREKNRNGFPEAAIRSILSMKNLDWTDVDAYVFGGHETYTELGLKEGDRSARIRSYKEMLDPIGQVKRMLRDTPLRGLVHRQRREADIQKIAANGVSRNRIFSIEHHRCHASTAFYGPGMDRDAIVFTVDGAGDSLCATVSIPGTDGRLQRLTTIAEEHSIGNLWSVITSLMSMVPLEHEYKLMGMAPYASGDRVSQAKKIFHSAFQMTGDGWNLASGVPNTLFSYNFWRKRLEFTRFDYICAGLQSFTEEFLTAWIQGWLQKTGRRKVRLSGGVFMNVKLNKVIGELPEVDDLFVFPSCGDETNSIGAAWAYLEDRNQATLIEPLKTLFLGPEPTETEYRNAANRASNLGWTVSAPTELDEVVAELLSQGQVVARATGREEFGARSLGNRAILADPIRTDVIKTVNKAIKNRDFWMPFAPSIMQEHADRYVDNPKNFSAPYMILAFDSRNRDEVKAACHPEDATIRPQIVSHMDNPQYHRLIELFHRKTGRGAILNTSLNIHGEPIVSTPDDAIDVMRRSGLLHLALGPYLISKPDGLRQ